MDDLSVNGIITILKKYDLIDENYKNIVSDLFSYISKKAIYRERVEQIASSLPKYSSVPKITGYYDLHCLTLTPEELKAYLDGFNEYGDAIKLRQLGCFRAEPNGIFKRIKHCVQNGIPYVDTENVLFNEINFPSESNLYLDGFYLKDKPGNKLTDQEIDLYNKVCGLLQTLVFKNSPQNQPYKLPIYGTVKDNIINAIKDNPTLSAEDIKDIVIESTPFLHPLVTTPELPPISSMDNISYGNRNGRLM